MKIQALIVILCAHALSLCSPKTPVIGIVIDEAQQKLAKTSPRFRSIEQAKRITAQIAADHGMLLNTKQLEELALVTLPGSGRLKPIKKPTVLNLKGIRNTDAPVAPQTNQMPNEQQVMAAQITRLNKLKNLLASQ
jgi:hypothetical protein